MIKSKNTKRSTQKTTRTPRNSNSNPKSKSKSDNKVIAFLKDPVAPVWIYAFLTLIIVTISTISTCFTVRQISIYERATKYDLRAYLTIKDVNIIMPKIGTSNMGWVEYENIGKTPAYELKHHIATLFDTCITAHAIASINKPFNYAGFVFGPNNPIRQDLEFGRIFTADDYSIVMQGKGKLYAIGNIVYEDIFHQQHFTRFCGEWVPKTGKTLIIPEYFNAN